MDKYIPVVVIKELEEIEGGENDETRYYGYCYGNVL